MNLEIRQAGVSDLPELLALMHDFYAESQFPLNLERARTAFLPLLGPSELGQVLLAVTDGAAGGHLVLTFCHSMEYGGRTAFIDDLYVRPTVRNQGVGKALLARARVACDALGVRAVHVEVGRTNDPAQTIYRRAGFRSTDRELLRVPLADPTHAA